MLKHDFESTNFANIIILVGLMMTWFSEKMLIFNICRLGLMPTWSKILDGIYERDFALWWSQEVVAILSNSMHQFQFQFINFNLSVSFDQLHFIQFHYTISIDQFHLINFIWSISVYQFHFINFILSILSQKFILYTCKYV